MGAHDAAASRAASPRPLQRHPKCSALYATAQGRQHRRQHARDSELNSDSPPPSVAYLAFMTAEVAHKPTNPGTVFEVTVHDRKSNSTWRHARSYAECRAFQQRVLRALRRGHLCFAECPWLFAYVQRALPAERAGQQLFRVAGRGPRPRVAEKRRQAVARLFATLQRVLLNPLNQRCAVLMQHVAPEVVGFMTNHRDSEPMAPWQQRSPVGDRPLARTFSESFVFEDEQQQQQQKADASQSYSNSTSTTTSSLDDSDDLDSDSDAQVDVEAADDILGGQRVCCAMCALHASRSDEQVFAYWRAQSSVANRLRRLRSGPVPSSSRNRSSTAAQLSARVFQGRQSAQNSTKGAQCSPRLSERPTSPLDSTAEQIPRQFETPPLDDLRHDGTPTEPFPGTPRESSCSELSEACEIDLELVDAWRPSGEVSPSPMAPSFVNGASGAEGRHTEPETSSSSRDSKGRGSGKLRSSLRALKGKLCTPKRRSGTII